MMFRIIGYYESHYCKAFVARSWRDVRLVLRSKGPFTKTIIIRRPSERWTRTRC